MNEQKPSKNLITEYFNVHCAQTFFSLIFDKSIEIAFIVGHGYI